MGRHRNSFGSDNGTPPDSPRTVLQHSSPYSGELSFPHLACMVEQHWHDIHDDDDDGGDDVLQLLLEMVVVLVVIVVMKE